MSNLRFNEGIFTLKVFWKVRIVIHFILLSMSDSQRIQYWLNSDVWSKHEICSRSVALVINSKLRLYYYIRSNFGFDLRFRIAFFYYFGCKLPIKKPSIAALPSKRWNEHCLETCVVTFLFLCSFVVNWTFL